MKFDVTSEDVSPFPLGKPKLSSPSRMFSMSINSKLFLLLGIGILFGGSLMGQRSADEMRTLTGPLLDRALVKEGEQIPDSLRVFSEAGEEASLRDIVNGKYTVLVSGCLTCPIFHRTYPGVEAVYQDYKGREDIQFFYLYKTLAHPEYNGYIQPVSIEERLQHITEAKRVLDTSLPWLCDTMENTVRHTLGLGPNTQVVVSPEGKIVHTLGWSDGALLRKELIQFVGDTEKHTQVSEVSLKKGTPALAQKAWGKSGLERPQFDETLVPLIFSVVGDSKHPLYVKPRFEATPSVLQRGRGDLYLGFRLDPIHGVHWNNLAAPLQFELDLPEGFYATPKRAQALEVSMDADADPREFVVEITSAQPGHTFGLTVRYFACSDEEGWCIPVTQSYEVTLAADQDGGGTMGRSFERGGNRNGRQGNQTRRGPGQGGRMEGGPPQMKQRLMQADIDGDGMISRSEAPEPMRARFDQADKNLDELLDEAEVDAFIALSSGQRGGSGMQQRRSSPIRQRGNPAQQLMNFDANDDGKLTLEELPPRMQQRFGRMDENGDGFVDQEEVDAMSERLPGGQGRRALQPERSGRERI